ncbi:DUF222 domain-containing protein [Gordonia sp. (in: high G+C Gram-positive bacteria)]|uniref:DUF222 domain-containing protein n=1 Tax=Gordonia sp. (in: high G+C Gram-positive bacteria) TaxID=84139 RepID=UPI00261A74C2|nr:DUF222 domain-containing protein [Gordonia sp. (in: high G+C Gram-positive bacteria)]
MERLLVSTWPDADLTGVGICAEGTATEHGGTLVDLARGLNACRNGIAFLDWRQLEFALAVYQRVRTAVGESQLAAVERSVLDVYAQTALQLQFALESTRYFAEMLLDDAFAARDRLPLCASLLRTGRIDRRRFHKIVVATDLILDPLKLALVDASIHAEITALGAGTALPEKQVVDLAARHVAEIDPDAVRRARDDAKAGRCVRTRVLEHGMAQMTVTATAEDIRIADRWLDAQVAGLCPHDPRTKAAARADAAIAGLHGVPFACLCARADCTAQISPEELAGRAARVIVHVLCQAATLDGSSQKCGVMDGHGPVSAAHVRELAARPDAKVRLHDLNQLLDTGPETAAEAESKPAPRLRANPTEPAADVPATSPVEPVEAPAEAESKPGAHHRANPDGPDPDRDGQHRPPGPPPEWLDDWDTALTALSAEYAAREADPSQQPETTAEQPPPSIVNTAQPGDPYRPTALTDLTVRFLWHTCVTPGCGRPAYSCDLDHCAEFDHTCPASGGPTCLCNLFPRCRLHHLQKTFLDGFIDDLWIDQNGHYRSTTTLPGGLTTDTVAPNQWLIPQLAFWHCRHPRHAGTATPSDGPAPERSMARTEAKHARRRAERARNRRNRQATESAAAQAEADEQVRNEAGQAWLDSLGDPPF